MDQWGLNKSHKNKWLELAATEKWRPNRDWRCGQSSGNLSLRATTRDANARGDEAGHDAEPLEIAGPAGDGHGSTPNPGVGRQLTRFVRCRHRGAKERGIGDVQGVAECDRRHGLGQAVRAERCKSGCSGYRTANQPGAPQLVCIGDGHQCRCPKAPPHQRREPPERDDDQQARGHADQGPRHRRQELEPQRPSPEMLQSAQMPSSYARRPYQSVTRSNRRPATGTG